MKGVILMSLLRKNAQSIVCVVRLVGGKLVGRTRLQKTIYLLQAAGWEGGFQFQYYHYGPYCEDLAEAANFGVVFNMMREEEHPTAWGSTYSTYTVDDLVANQPQTLPDKWQGLACTATKAGAIELELAATAVYLYKEEGINNPWEETSVRKSQKAGDGRLNGAQKLYDSLRTVAPSLPDLPK